MLPRNMSGTLTIVNICGETREPLPGARYAITNRARRRAVRTCCEKGIARFAGLPNGIYRLEESRPPAGYQANAVVYKIAVYNGRIAVNGKCKRDLTHASMPLLPNQGQAPAINPVHAEDALVSGAGRAGRRITLTFPNGRQAFAKVQPNNAWRASVPPDTCLSPGEIILASQRCEDAPGGGACVMPAGDTAAAVVIEGPTAIITGTVFPVPFDPGECDAAWSRGPAFLEANAAVVRLRTLEGYEVLRARAQPIGYSGEGKYAFEGVPAGQYMLHVQRPGFLPCAQLVKVKSGAVTVKQECAAVRLTAIRPARRV